MDRQAGIQHLSKNDISKTIYFGMDVSEAEKILGANLKNDPHSMAKPGIEKIISTKELILRFDSGKLKQMEFTEYFDFGLPLSPFKEEWKNFSTFNDLKIKVGMEFIQFQKIVQLWEEALQKSGLKKIEKGGLEGREYRINFISNKLFNTCHIALGPSRKTSKGGLWQDAWHFDFSPDKPLRGGLMHGFGPNHLIKITAFNDEFNTFAR